MSSNISPTGGLPRDYHISSPPSRNPEGTSHDVPLGQALPKSGVQASDPAAVSERVKQAKQEYPPLFRQYEFPSFPGDRVEQTAVHFGIIIAAPSEANVVTGALNTPLSIEVQNKVVIDVQKVFKESPTAGQAIEATAMAVSFIRHPPKS